MSPEEEVPSLRRSEASQGANPCQPKDVELEQSSRGEDCEQEEQCLGELSRGHHLVTTTESWPWPLPMVSASQ